MRVIRSKTAPPLLRRRLLSAVAFALVLGTTAGATVKPPQVDLEVVNYTLPNGLEVILHEDHRLPIVAVNIWYHVGALQEEAGRTGFAHLFEHMMFQASGHIGDDQIWKHFEGAGASFVNGSTEFERTNYMETLPSNQLELALWVESDRMGYLLDRLDQAALSNQQDVVRNERRQSVENRPYGLMDERLYQTIYPKGHPYYASVIGSHADIQAAQLVDVRDFFTSYYCPNNASLCIVGDIDVAKTKGMIEKYFGTLPRGAEVPMRKVDTPPITSERRVEMTDTVELPRVSLAWMTAPVYQAGHAEAQLTARVLAGGKSSRLYRALVYEQQIAQEVSAYVQPLSVGSILEIDATARPGHTAQELSDAIDAELARLRETPPTEAELDAAKTAIWAHMVKDLENLNGWAWYSEGVANLLNTYNHYLDDPGFLSKDLARFASVKPEAVRKLADETLVSSKRVAILCSPGEKVIPDAPEPGTPVEKVASTIVSKEPWRNDVPMAGAVSTEPLPSAASFTLANGLTCHVVTAHHLPIVAAQVVVRAGSANDPPSKPGLAGFTAAMLDEGTSKHDALSLARELDALGAELSSGSSPDGSFVTSVSLKQRAKETLALLAEVATQPSFPEEEVERVRSTRKTQLLQAQDDPQSTAFRVMRSCLWGADHPYGHEVLGLADALESISRDDIVGSYRANYAPQNAALVLAGDLTVAEAKKLAEDSFGAWQGDAAASKIPGLGASIPNRLIIVDKPGNPQTMLLCAELGVKRADPDFEALRLMNQALGGTFGSRLNMNLREDKGYTYGAFSFISENRGQGMIALGASVQADKSGASIAEMMKEIEGMLSKPITDEEVRSAKEAISRSLPALFETTGSTAGTIGNLYLQDQATDYYQSLPDRIAKLSRADIAAATARHLHPEKMLMIAVGDRAQIESQINELSIGKIAYRGVDGRAVDPSLSQPGKPEMQ